MNRPVPVLQRHKDEAFKAFNVTSGVIHLACSQACANIDFVSKVDLVWNLVSSSAPIGPEHLAAALDIDPADANEWAAQILGEGEKASRDDAEVLVLLGWK